MEVGNKEIKLPRKIPYTVTADNLQDADDEGRQLISKVVNYIEARSYCWGQEENFHYELPVSIFNEMTTIHFEGHENFELEYWDRNSSLNSEQHKQIWRKGQFEVQSRIENLPYVWKLSQWTVKGYDNVKNSLCDDLANSFFFLYMIKYRFTTRDYQSYCFSFPSAFYSFYEGLWYIVDVFLGLPSYELNRDREGCITALKREALLDLILRNPKIDIQFYSKTYRSRLTDLEKTFEIYWEKEELMLEQKYYDQEIPPNEIKVKIREDKEKAMLEFINGSSDIPKEKLQYLNSSINALRLVFKHIFHFEEKNQIERSSLYKEISDQNYIKSRIQEWLDAEVKQRQSPIIESRRQAMNTAIEGDLLNYPEPLSLWKHHLDFEKTLEQKVEEKLSQVPKTYSYRHTFTVTRICFPPFKVKREIDYAGNAFYTLEKTVTYTIYSSFPLWRLWILLVEYFSYTINVMIVLLHMAFNSAFGLKALCYCTLYTDVTINYTTGEISPSSPACVTYPTAIANLCTWICESRDRFESEPDTGMFGKCFSRIFNLIENYFLKLIVLGVFIVFGYPILILLWTFTTLVVGLTAPLWMVPAVICIWLFNILFYDFFSVYVYCPIFPLIYFVSWYIVLKGVIQLIFTFIAFIFQPLLSIFLLLLGLIRYLLRFFYDCIMFVFVLCLARVPQSDSGLAWKISGPGLFRNRYNKISLQDAISIVHAKLERIELSKYQETVKKCLHEPRENIEHKIVKLFNKIGMQYSYQNIISNSIYFNERLLDTQIRERESLFPYVSNVKYSATELEMLKNMSREYIIEYVESHQMNYIWEDFSLAPESWTRLTEEILIRAFGNQILETLEENDFRVELKRNMNNAFDEACRRIIENPRLERFKAVEHKEVSAPVKLPKYASIGSLYSSDCIFNMDLNNLSEQERINLVGQDY